VSRGLHVRLRTFRLAAAVLCLCLTAVTLAAFATVEYVGAFYVAATRSAGTALPLLTAQVALPLLRVAPGDPHRRPVTLWWVWLVWGALLVMPLATAALVARSGSLDAAVARLVLGLGAHGTLILAVAVTVLAGLAMAVACM